MTPLVTTPAPMQTQTQAHIQTPAQASSVQAPQIQSPPVKPPPVQASSVQAPPVQAPPIQPPPVQTQEPQSDGDMEAGENSTIDEGGEEALLNDGRSTTTDATELLNDL